jgi:hypothetical protein
MGNYPSLSEFSEDMESKPILEKSVCAMSKETIDFTILMSKYSDEGESYLERMLKIVAKIERNREDSPLYRIKIVNDTIPNTPRDIHYVPVKMEYDQLVYFLEGMKFSFDDL